MPEWEKRLAKNPELLLDHKTPFEFAIDTGTRAFKVKFNTPMSIIYGDPKWIADGAREEFVSDKQVGLRARPDSKRADVIYVRDVKDLESTWNFLTGAGGGTTALQTDCYGIVPFDPENAIVNNYEEMGLLDDILSDDAEVAAKARERLLKSRVEAAQRQKAAFSGLINISEERIRRSLRSKHNNLIAQWQTLDEQKINRYPPSLAERLGFNVLKTEIESREKSEAASVDIGNEMMNKRLMG